MSDPIDPGDPTFDPASTDPPLSLFESAILETRKQLLPFAELLRAFLDEPLAVPSAAPIAESFTDLRPPTVVVDGEEYVAVFTHSDRAVSFQEEFPYLAAITGRVLLTMIKPNVGIVVDPRSPAYAFQIPAVALDVARQRWT